MLQISGKLLANLALVCSHHHLVHDNGWKLGPKEDGAWLLTPPHRDSRDLARHCDPRRQCRQASMPALAPDQII